jgi:acyl-CoA hydrolase
MTNDAKHAEQDHERRPGAVVHLDEWVTPDVADDRGLLRAGKILEWMDVVGVLVATRHARHPAMTASVDGIDLQEPIPLGARVAMTAQIAYTSQRSMGISISLAHDAQADAEPHTCLEAYMTFVAIGADARAVDVPQISPETPAEHARFAEGQLRREFRRKLADGKLPLPGHSRDPLSEVAERDRPILLREILKMLPRTLRLPWERPDPPLPRKRHRTYIHKIEPVRSGKLNLHGTLYGGTLMRWIETTAALAARAHVNAATRLSGLHGLNFIAPGEQHRFIHLRAVVVHAAARRVTVLVNVQSEDPIASTYREMVRAFLTYAPVDATTRVSPVECVSDEEHALYQEVEQRLALQRTLWSALARAS